MMLTRRFSFVREGILFLAIALLATPCSARAEGGYVFVTQWGSYGAGNGQFEGGITLAVDGPGNVYVAEFGLNSPAGNPRIQKFTHTGAFVTQWGGLDMFPGGPVGVATDGAGYVYVIYKGFNDFIWNV